MQTNFTIEIQRKGAIIAGKNSRKKLRVGSETWDDRCWKKGKTLGGERYGETGKYSGWIEWHEQVMGACEERNSRVREWQELR